MVKRVWRAALGLGLAYCALLAFLYFAQASMLYPAPQERSAPAEGFTAVSLATEDGLALTAHWLAPEADQPTLVHFHGNGGSLAGATVETALLAAQGYGVLLVEYRGYGGNPGIPSEDGFYRDGRAAMAFLAAQGIAPSRTVISGHSMGSGTATEMAHAFRPAALVLFAPFTSLPDAAAERFPFVPVGLLLRDRFDNIAKAGELTMPVLVIHGTEDKVIPIAHGRALAEAASDGTFRALKGEGHDISLLTAAQIAESEWLASHGL